MIGAFTEKGNAANIDDVMAYLVRVNDERAHDARISDMVTLLKKYSPTQAPAGSLGARIFNAASSLASNDVKRERFIVLELGELEHQPELLKSVLFALILHIEHHMYLGDLARKKLCVIDEAWRLLSGSNRTAAGFIEKGFRTARKYHGAL